MSFSKRHDVKPSPDKQNSFFLHIRSKLHTKGIKKPVIGAKWNPTLHACGEEEVEKH